MATQSTHLNGAEPTTDVGLVRVKVEGRMDRCCTGILVNTLFKVTRVGRR